MCSCSFHLCALLLIHNAGKTNNIITISIICKPVHDTPSVCESSPASSRAAPRHRLIRNITRTGTECGRDFLNEAINPAESACSRQPGLPAI